MYDFVENIQRGILHLVLKDRDFFTEVINLIQPEYFENPPHEKIYSVAYNYFEEYKLLPTKDILLQELKGVMNQKEHLSDYEDELFEIDALNPEDVENKEYLMDLVEGFAKRESMKAAIREGVRLINEDNPEAIEEVIKKALLIGRDIDYGQVYFKDVQERWIRENENRDEIKYPTILEKCNKYLDGGNSRKELCMVVATPGTGKSLFLVNQGVRTLMTNKKVLFVTLEMSQDKVAKRFDSIMTMIPHNQLGKPTGQRELRERHQMFKEKFPNAELIIKEFPTGQANVNNIRQLLSKLDLHEGFRPDLIIVDYLELLLPIRKTEAEYMAQQRIAEEIRGMAMEFNILIWTATQTNRQGESVELITRRELGDSYGKIRTADWAISLNQTAEEYDNGQMRGYIIKSRDSKQKYIIPMSVNYSTLVMEQRSDASEAREEA